MSILDTILVSKRDEVAALHARESREALRARARSAAPPRDFKARLSGKSPSASGLRVIAEFKRASPSKGPIRPDADAREITRAYAEAGATALSVLTDEPFFQGNLEDVAGARAVTSLPILRKDFIIDLHQVWESRAAGADAILLIAQILEDVELTDLARLAEDLGMAALVEVHNREEMERVREMKLDLVGINNRDLSSLAVNLETTEKLMPFRPEHALLVSESGFSRREEMEPMLAWGVNAFLMGESLMRAPDPGEALRAITGGPAGEAHEEGERSR